MYAFGETYEGAMSIPVEIRKWLIKRWNKQKKQEQAPADNTDKPLRAAERMKMIKQAQQASNTPSRPLDPSEFLSSRRNQNS